MRHCLLLLLLPLSSFAQFQDDFNDGEFNNPQWFGDTAQFSVNNNRLQLAASGSGTAALTYTRNQPSHQEHEWSFRLKLVFSPSSQNYARYYFFADQPVPAQAMNALYLQAGESGSNDAPCLYLLTNGSGQLLARGIDGSIAAASELIYNLQCDSNYFWSLTTTLPGGTSQLQFVTQQLISTNGNYGGWQCTYTSSNASGFYLDDVYDGIIRHDTLPPLLTTATFIDSDTLLLQWNEPVSVYNASVTINNQVISFLSGDDSASRKIFYAGGFVSGTSYTIELHNVRDTRGNTAVFDSLTIPYVEAIYPEAGDIILSEIMADPDDANQLPEAEYVEIYNRSNHYLLTDSLILSDGSSDAQLPSDTIAPFGYKVYAGTSAATLLQNAGIEVRAVSTFPSLNNSGDNLEMKSLAGKVYDRIVYTEATYQHDLKSQGGWSLEKIDLDFPCQTSSNWKASEAYAGGTPGIVNSTNNYYQDNEPPCLLFAVLVDSLHLRLHLSEIPDKSDALNPQLYSLTGVDATVAAVQFDDGTDIQLTLTDPVITDQPFTVTIASSFRDCSGNTIHHCNSVQAGKGHLPLYGDILINELLFNPRPDGNDFLEIRNVSDKMISLDSLLLARKTEGVVTDIIRLQANGRCLAPGEYLAITSSAAKLADFYPVVPLRQILENETVPMNDDAGVVALLDPAFTILDEVVYDEDFHHPLLADAEGVSLERVSPHVPSMLSSSWHSAASSVGYATPGYRNSQETPSAAASSELQLEYVLFSPDNDGEKDLLPVIVAPDAPGFICHLSVFSFTGQTVRVLSDHELAGVPSHYHWDGLDEERRICQPGIYGLRCELFHPDGRRKVLKAACVLARRF